MHKNVGSHTVDGGEPLKGFKGDMVSPGQCGSVSWIVIPQTERLQVRSSVGAHSRGNRLMFLSHIDVSLPLSSPSPLSKINEHVLR